MPRADSIGGGSSPPLGLGWEKRLELLLLAECLFLADLSYIRYAVSKTKGLLESSLLDAALPGQLESIAESNPLSFEHKKTLYELAEKVRNHGK